MKKTLSILLALMLLVSVCPFGLFTFSASAVTSGTTGDCTWSLNGTVLTISGNGKTGNYGDYYAPWGNSITEVIIKDGVTCIDAWVFENCSALTSVSIPASVTSIGEGAFAHCSSLTRVTLPNSVTSIGKGAFYDCVSLIAITIPDSVTSIGSYAFENCSALTSVTIGNGVTSIGRCAFYGCSSLTRITIPESVTSIGREAFSWCGSLTSISIPASVTSIGDDAFSNTGYYNNSSNWENNALYIGKHLIEAEKDISNAYTIKQGTLTVSDCAFYGCSSLTRVTIPESVTSIGSYAFVYCTSLSSITVDGNNKYYSSQDGVLFNKDKTMLIQYPVGKKSTTYTISESVTSIGEEAFAYCSAFTSITIPESVTSIGEGAFYGCSSLTSVTIGNSVTSIGEGAFEDCSALTSVTIPESVTSINEWVFAYCSSLTRVTIPASVTSIGYSAFYNCDSLTDVYYGGSYASRQNIDIDSFNVKLTNATWHYVTKLNITKQPVSVKVQNGATATVTVEAEGEGLTYSWYYKNYGDTKFYLTGSFKTNVYSVAMTYARDGRQLYCVITDKSGNTVTTDVVTISMVETAVTITKQPASVVVKSGQTATVTFEAAGAGLTYKWYFKNKGESVFKVTDTFAGNTYTATMNDFRNGRQVYCVVTDKYGNTVKTETVTISMPEPVKITKQPVSVKVQNGQTVTVTFKAEGEGLTYKWYYRNKNTADFIVTNTFSGNTYTAVMNDARNGRQIYCVVTDKYGNTVTTDTVTISMPDPVKITKQPASVTVANGKTATVTIGAVGEGLTYKWYFKNKRDNQFYSTSAFTTHVYEVEMNETRDGRQLYCVITDKYGNTVTTDVVTIGMAKTAVAITKQPASVVVKSGETAIVTFEAIGDGLTYKWYFKNKGESVFKVTDTFDGNTYTAIMNDFRNGRQIYCVVTDMYGNTVKTDTVTVAMASSLKIVKQPTSVKVVNGETATVTFEAEGEGLTYKWYYKNKGTSDFILTNTFSGNTYTTVMNDARNGRQLYCVITDKYGNTVTTDVVTINMEKTAVAITKQPTSVIVEDDQTATVTFEAIGDGLTYKWYFKNKGESKFRATDTFSGNTYTAIMNESRNGREIYCVVTDKYGNTVNTEVVTIEMFGPVKIIKQPTNVSMASGDKATITVEALGAGLKYKWYYKDVNDGSYKLSTSFTGNSYSVIVSFSTNGRKVGCVVTDKYGNSVASNVVTISCTSSMDDDYVPGENDEGFGPWV